MTGPVERQRQLVEHLRFRLPDAPSTGAEVIETHISWVLLTTEYAYKLKKAVDLGFVDYTSLERRAHFCTEELRLNRRTAAELYLDVVPVGGTPEAPQPGTEPALEYLVRMRRFAAPDQFDRLLAAGRLPGRRVDEFAGLVAGFHLGIPHAPPQSGYGRPETIRRPVDQNFEHLSEMVSDPAVGGLLEQQYRWVQEQFEQLHAFFEDRRNKGFVRECHGDLHLGNVALFRDRVLAFDCIEFNPELRWIDVASEIAFTLMDFQEHGRADLAFRFLDRYLAITGDFDALPLLRFYQHYRAMVRAKVSAIRLQDPTLDRAGRLAAIEQVGGYLTLAQRYSEPPEPRLVLTRGPSGSGKSSWAARLLEMLGAVRLRSDVERKRLYGLAPEDRSGQAQPGEGLYGRAANEATYRRLEELAEQGIRAGYTVIVDAAALRHEQRRPFQALAERLDVPYRLLDFTAPRPELEARVARRLGHGRDPSDADLAVLHAQLDRLEPLQQEELSHALAVDTGKPVDEAALLSFCRRR